MWRSMLVSAVVSGALVALPLPASATVGPPNDDFAAAQDVGSGATGCVSGDNTGATYESFDEPSVISSPIDGTSVWFAWSAPASGAVTFTTYLHSLPDSTLGAYSGPDLASLAFVDSNDDHFGLASSITFSATSGTTYYIRVAGYAGAMGAFRLGWNGGCAPPDNDDFADATTLTGPSGSTLSQTSTAATYEAGEASLHSNCVISQFPCSSATNDLGFASVWYSWTAPGDATVAFCLTQVPTIYWFPEIGVYTGALGSLVEVAYGGNGAACGLQITFDATDGTTYHIGIGGDQGGQGDYTLAWHPTDTTAPTALVAPDGPPGLWNVSPAAFTVTFSEVVTGFDATDLDLTGSTATLGTATVTDSGDGMAYDVSIPVTSGGDVKLQVPADSAEDAATNGNVASNQASITFDLTAPTLSAVTVRLKGAQATATWTGSDANGVTFECRLDAEGYAACVSPWVRTVTSGVHTASVKATDGAGNTTTHQAVFTVKSKRVK